MKRIGLLLLAIVFAACDPTIKQFDIKPEQIKCAGEVTITYEGTGDGLHINASAPVTPALPATLSKKGTLTTTVNQTTEFSLYYPGAGHREKTVTVSSKGCSGSGGPSTCGPQTLTFTGTCFSSQQGPQYITVNLGANVAPGNITAISHDVDWPVHVQHLGQEIALGAGGQPLFPLPAVAAAGDYTITVPGQPGMLMCKDAGPTSGTTEAEVTHITVTPTCPKP
jgi:hypothetical protein